jgi:hypothetical protein
MQHQLVSLSECGLPADHHACCTPKGLIGARDISANSK